MDNIIDLRKQPELLPPHKELPRPHRTEDLPEHIEAILTWTAFEYDTTIYSKNWFLVAGSIALVFIVIAIVIQSYFFLTLVALAFLVTIMYVKQTPREITFAITKEGVYIGRALLPWSRLKSFWVFEKQQGKELSLETDKTLMPYAKIPLGELDIAALRELLKSSLPEKEHQELVADEIARHLGF